MRNEYKIVIAEPEYKRTGPRRMANIKRNLKEIWL
jgi:hypothetical protein